MKTRLFYLILAATWALPALAAEPQVSRSVLYLIHSDASMIYLDHSGVRHSESEEALQQARDVAKQCTDCEVFIFHQKAPVFLLGLDGMIELHRNGKQITSFTFNRNYNGLYFEYETDFYRKNSKLKSGGERLLAYFGHTIPEVPMAYSLSYPNAPVSLEAWTKTLRGFAKEDRTPFALVVMSSCSNATPWAAHLFQPLSEFLIASPEGQPLQMMDTRAFARSDLDPASLAQTVGEQSYAKLVDVTYSAVSLSIFDLRRIQISEESLSLYQKQLEEFGDSHRSKRMSYQDCRKIGLDLPAPTSLFFRPNQVLKNREQTHSGWQCPIAN